MNRIKIFRALTYILSVPTAFLGFFSLLMIPLALMNIQAAIMEFVFICVVIYVVNSFVFLNKTIIQQKKTKKIVKDLFKINGTIASFFAIICILDFVSLLVNPSIISIGIAKAMEQNPTSLPPQITKEMLMKFFWFLLTVIGIYSILLSIHLVIGFRLMKEYASSFLQE